MFTDIVDSLGINTLIDLIRTKYLCLFFFFFCLQFTLLISMIQFIRSHFHFLVDGMCIFLYMTNGNWVLN